MKAEQLTLYPTLDSLQAVLEQANSQLPIMTKNELVALLAIHTNTVLKLIEEQNDEDMH